MMLLVTGGIIDAVAGARLGLVAEDIADDELLDHALEITSGIVALLTGALTPSKRCVTVGFLDGMAAGLLPAAELSVEVGLSDVAVEGQQAFMETRQPHFSNSVNSGVRGEHIGKEAS